jgi:galactose mutarotase-like enzyme
VKHSAAPPYPVEQFTLTNKNGVEVRAITYGGIITSVRRRIAPARWATSCSASIRSTAILPVILSSRS